MWTKEGRWNRGVEKTLYVYYYSDQSKKNEMGAACSTYGGKERCIEGFGGENRGKESTWKT